MHGKNRRTGRRARGVAAIAGLVALGLATPALAGEEATLEAVLPLEAGRITRQEHPFAFVTDPSTPSAGVLSLDYALGLGSGIAADRPLPVNMASAGGSQTVQVGYGLTDSVSPFANVTFASGVSASQPASYQAGLTWQPTRPDARLRLSVSAAGLHEGVGGANGVTAVAAVSLDQGPVRLAANVRTDRVFAPGRDGVDAFVLLGGVYQLTHFLRMGAEAVGQDLEEAFEAEAEGGAQYSLGPTAALDLDGGRYQLALCSGFGLTARSPRMVVRATLAVNF